MPELDIAIGTPVNKNIDGSIVSDSAARLMNGFLDDEGNINTFCGLLSVGSLSNNQIDGLYWWDDISRLVALCNGHIWTVTQAFSKADLSASGPATVMSSGVGVRPTFATDGTKLFIANGGRIVQTDGLTAASTVVIADADAPTAVTHVAFIDGYIFAFEAGTGTLRWSNLNDGTAWDALDFATAEANPDDIVAVHIFRKEIYVFGKVSLEVWEDDGQSPFAPVNGGVVDTGCIAPYSVVRTDDSIIWLSDKKRFVQYFRASNYLISGDIKGISSPFDSDLDDMLVVSDCIADRIDILGTTFLTFTFPAENRTLMYNATDKNWSELGEWNASGGYFNKWVGSCHAFSPLWNQHFIGSSKNDGLIYLLSPKYKDNNGSPLVMERITGHSNRGTNKIKRCDQFSMSVKRGNINDTTEPVITLAINDDNRGFGNEKQISLGKTGDTNNMVVLHRMGMYRNRQYRLRCSEATGVAFGSAKEDIYVGTR